jgi:AraC family transcriptional regulator
MRSSQTVENATQQDYQERLLRVLEHIHAHLDSNCDLDELAAIACFSPYHFHRIFTGMVGESVKAYIRRLRMERAAAQLKTSKSEVIQIALDAGYETHEAFTRAFKSSYGAAPSKFRSQPNRVIQIASPSRIHWDQPLDSFRPNRSGLRFMKVEIKTIPSRRVAFVRHVGPYNNVGIAWEKLCSQLGKDGWVGGDTLFIGVCYDDPDVTPPEKIRYDACITVNDQFQPVGDVGVQVLPGGEFATTTHTGPYEALSKSYSRLMGQWLPRSGRKLGTNPGYEIYLNSPENTAPKDLLTDLYVPLEPVNA